MKANELAEITAKAIAKKNNERPAKLLVEVHALMKSAAESGESYLNHAFSDSMDILSEVYAKLEDEGYQIATHQGAKKNLTKISWEKKFDTQCGFDIAWVGRCKEPADTTGFCAKHRLEKCRCGRQAVRECEATIGAFVCGHLTCGSCTHHH